MEYMRMQVKAHEAAVKLFQTESSKGTDADVKGFAAANLPALQTHLEMARTMSGNMKNGGGNMNSGNMNNMNMNSNGNSDSNRSGTNSNSNNNRNRNSNTNRNSSNSNSNTNSNSNRR
jgi:uncharacterized protein (DUF305 family)